MLEVEPQYNMLIRLWGHHSQDGLVYFSKDQLVPARLATYSRASQACTPMLSCLLSLHMNTYKYTPAAVSQIQLPCCAVIHRDPHQDTRAVVFGPISFLNHEPWNSLYKLLHFVCFYSNTDSNYQFSGILTKLIFGENIVKKATAWVCCARSPAAVDTGLFW